MRWVVVKRLGRASRVLATGLGAKWKFVLCIGVWFVIELGFQLYMKRYVL